VEWILVDWTRMGRTYCLAGAVLHGAQARILRPLPARSADAPVRNVGWSPFLTDGRQRWEVFELIAPTPAEPQPPHLEDVWVRSLRPRARLATPAERHAILHATLGPPGEPAFGVPWTLTQASAFLEPASGERSLASIIVAARELIFTAAWRSGLPDPDFRVSFGGAELAGRSLPVKDHFLLKRAEQASRDLEVQLHVLRTAVEGMGQKVLVRLGLSRPFQATPHRGQGKCWLMADGFFSLENPQP
jgi:hypothetical protein